MPDSLPVLSQKFMDLTEFKIEILYDIQKQMNDLILRVEKHITEHETTYKLQKKFYAFIGFLSAFFLIATTITNLVITLKKI